MQTIRSRTVSLTHSLCLAIFAAGCANVAASHGVTSEQALAPRLPVCVLRLPGAIPPTCDDGYVLGNNQARDSLICCASVDDTGTCSGEGAVVREPSCPDGYQCGGSAGCSYCNLLPVHAAGFDVDHGVRVCGCQERRTPAELDVNGEQSMSCPTTLPGYEIASSELVIDPDGETRDQCRYTVNIRNPNGELLEVVALVFDYARVSSCTDGRTYLAGAGPDCAQRSCPFGAMLDTDGSCISCGCADAHTAPTSLPPRDGVCVMPQPILWSLDAAQYDACFFCPRLGCSDVAFVDGPASGQPFELLHFVSNGRFGEYAIGPAAWTVDGVPQREITRSSFTYAFEQPGTHRVCIDVPCATGTAREQICKTVQIEPKVCAVNALDFEFSIPALVTPNSHNTLLATHANTPPLSFTYVLRSQPEYGLNALSLDGDGVVFRPTVVGTYEICADAWDGERCHVGRRCQQIEVRPAVPLHIELTWDSYADIDLRFKQSSVPWSDAQVCFFSYRQPDWGANGRALPDGNAANDPLLDVDNQSAFGPENIVQNELFATAEPLIVGAHYFARSVSRAPVGVVVRIFVYGVLVRDWRGQVRDVTDMVELAEITVSPSLEVTVIPVERRLRVAR